MIVPYNTQHGNKYELPTTTSCRSRFACRRQISTLLIFLFLFCFGVLAWLGYKKNGDISPADTADSATTASTNATIMSSSLTSSPFIVAMKTSLGTLAVSSPAIFHSNAHHPSTIKNKAKSTWKVLNHSKSQYHTMDTLPGKDDPYKAQHPDTTYPTFRTLMQGNSIGADSNNQDALSDPEG
ncbi:hypothetical protein BCR42DRAFT_152151 [Absidia repens]|uniref:Uncharacterized protein n=1 Tax=Absidia repens TaxID=90262 RepID=A0A1X2I231_9FUNG|nr:hypothetical protein BCR42DRAFT_152151 [Absidia repens]